MAALFLVLLIASCFVLWIVSGIGDAFRGYDRTVRRNRDRYDHIPEQRRHIERGGFKSRQGIR